MAYEQNKLAYSRTSNMPGLEYSQEDISQKKRIAANALGITPPADLLDGEFFLKDNDPQDFYRTLYIKRGDSLDKVVTFTNTGKAIFEGVNEINLSDDEEVKGVLPKKKLITAAATVQVDNISTIIGYDGNKFQEVQKDNFVNKVVDDVNAGINLANYYTKTETDNKYFNKNTDVASFSIGGTGASTKEQAQSNLQINPFERYNYKSLDLNKATNGVLVARMNYIQNNPTNLVNSGELIIETILGQDATTFTDNGPYTYNLQTYRERSGFAYAQRICAPNGAVGEWKKLRNTDGSIPADLIPATAKVTVADGVTWIETPLSNGKSMLYGIAQKTTTGDGLSTTLWKMIPPKSIDVSTIQLKANYLENRKLAVLFTATYESIIDLEYKNIVVSESSTEVAAPKYNFLLTMQAITA